MTTTDTLNTELCDLVKGDLEIGEQVLWIGKPDRLIRSMISIAATGLIFALYLSTLPLYVPPIVVFVVVFGLIVLLYWFLMPELQTIYAITNQRVLRICTVREDAKRLTAAPISTITNVRPDGKHTLAIITETSSIRFEQIRDADAATGQVKAALKGLIAEHIT